MLSNLARNAMEPSTVPRFLKPRVSGAGLCLAGDSTKEKNHEVSTRVRRRVSGTLAGVRRRWIKARLGRNSRRIVDEQRQYRHLEPTTE
jgi:hypothetical protein